MQEWEYDIWYLDPSRGTSSIRDELERRGREGWELVATPVAWDFDGAGEARQLVGILKRSVRAELPVAARRELAPGDVIYDPGPRIEPTTDLVPLPDDPATVEVVDAMIRRVKADLVANRRERVVADDKHKKLRTTHLRVELYLLKQSRTWVTTEADLAWVRSGLEAWQSAYGLRQPRRLEWLSHLRESGPAVAMTRSGATHEEDFVDADELRELLALTRGHKIGLLLAQEWAASVIVRDPSRTDAEVEAALSRVAKRKVLGRARIAVVRERMRASGLIPPDET
jgi:hypothetical protein